MAQEQQPSIEEQLTEYLAAHVANKRFSGNVLIAQHDSVLFKKSYGWANLDLMIPNTDSTRFLIGSITKPFTAYGIALLEQQGKLSFSDPLSTYFPDFPKSDSVSIKHLLTHRSGIRDYHIFPDWRSESQLDLPPLHTVEKVASHSEPYAFLPGSRFRYSNTGYIMLGLIIEHVSQQSFRDFVAQEICQPLGLKHTGVANNKRSVDLFATGYRSNPRSSVPAAYIDLQQPFSSGNMYSTTEDLWRFTQAVMNHELLSPEKTKQLLTDSAGIYSFGWGHRNFADSLAYGHHGAMNGFSGSLTYVLSTGHCIVFLTNDDNTPKATIASDLTRIVLGKAVTIPAPEKLVPYAAHVEKTIAGQYLVNPGDTLHIWAAEKQYFLQETGQEPLELFRIGEHAFSFEALEMKAVFSQLENEQAQLLTLEGHRKTLAQRIP